MNKLSLLSMIIPMGSLVIACTGGSGGQQAEPVKAKKQSSINSPAPVSAKTKAKNGAKTTTSHETDYGAFYLRLAIPEKDYTERDRQALMSFAPSPAGGSIHEAALVVGILRDIVTPVGGIKNTFKEVDILAGNPPQKDGTNVIDQPELKIERTNVFEIRCREKGVDCVTALASNPHLRNVAVYSMAVDAIRMPGNSPLFTQNLENVLKTEATLWGDIARRLGLGVQPVTTETAAAPATGLENKPDNSPTTEPTSPLPSEADNAAASQTMAKAVELAAKEDFEKAIVEARKIPQGADNFPAAQENIKSWANRAVQDLRRQAANQYRSSSATNEAAGKKAFLTKAKTHLQNAISKYPEASTLDTVKENLEIINKELERLN